MTYIGQYQADELLSDGTQDVADLISGSRFILTGGVPGKNVLAPVKKASSSVEDGTIGDWTLLGGAGGTATVSSDWAAHGTKSIKCENWFVNRQMRSTVTSTTAAATQYTFSATIYNNSGAQIQINVRYWDEIGGYGAGTTWTINNGVTQVISHTFSFTAGCTQRIAIFACISATATLFYLDQIQLEAGAAVTAFDEGFSEDSNFQLPHATGLLGAHGPVVAQAADNLFGISADAESFEDGGTGGWSPVRGTLANVAGGYHGSKELQFTVTDNTPAGQKVFCDVAAITAAGSQYTFSAWVKAGNAGAVGDSYGIDMYGNVSGHTVTNVTLTASWQRMAVTKTFNAGDTTRQAYLLLSNCAPVVGDIISLDAVQLESGAIATPYCYDKRLAVTERLATPFVAGQELSILVLCQTPWVGGTDSVSHYIWGNGAYAANPSMVLLKHAANDIRFRLVSGGINYYAQTAALGAAWTADTPHVIILTVPATGGDMYVYFDGVVGTTHNTVTREPTVAAYTYIGDNSGLGGQFNGSLLCAFWGRILTPAEIASLSAATSWTDITGGTLSLTPPIATSTGDGVIPAGFDASLQMELAQSTGDALIPTPNALTTVTAEVAEATGDALPPVLTTIFGFEPKRIEGVAKDNFDIEGLV